MVAKIGDEKDCRVVESYSDGKTKARNFCIVGGEPAMINSFSGLIGELAT